MRGDWRGQAQLQHECSTNSSPQVGIDSVDRLTLWVCSCRESEQTLAAVKVLAPP